MSEDPTNDILESTYRALCEHGYAALTLQDIAAESETSKATIHYHYGTKDELFSAFLSYLYERYTSRIDAASDDDPREHLSLLLEASLLNHADVPDQRFQTAILEVKAQAPYDDAIQQHLAEFDAYLFERLRTIVEAGVEAGEFDETVEPSAVADFLTTTVKGAHTRQVTVDHAPEQLYDTMIDYIETHLIADEPAEVSRR